MLKHSIFFIIFILLKNCNSNIINDEIKCLNNLPITQLIKIHKSLNTFQQCSISESSDLKNSNEENLEILNDSIESRILVHGNKNELNPLPLMGVKNFFKNTFSFNKNNNNNDYANENKFPFKDIERSDEHWEHEKPTKVTKIFQGSITALSFLAFSAYLLCMIVQAIKSKGTTYYYPVSTSQPFTAITPVKRIKVIRRTKRSTANQRKNLLKLRNSNEKRLQQKNPILEKNDRLFQKNEAKLNLEPDEIFNEIALPDPAEMYKILEQFAEGYVQIATIL